MPRRRVDAPLESYRVWVSAADAEWRWRRALRLLLALGTRCGVVRGDREDGHGDTSRGVCAGVDGPTGREPND